MPWVKLFEDITEVKERFGDKNPILLNVREQKVLPRAFTLSDL
jgi:chorismate mutase